MATDLIIDMLRELVWNWGPWIFNKYVEILQLGSKVYKSVQKGLYDTEYWIFIKESHIPIPEELFDTNHIAKASSVFGKVAGPVFVISATTSKLVVVIGWLWKTKPNLSLISGVRMTP